MLPAASTENSYEFRILLCLRRMNVEPKLLGLTLKYLSGFLGDVQWGAPVLVQTVHTHACADEKFGEFRRRTMMQQRTSAA